MLNRLLSYSSKHNYSSKELINKYMKSILNMNIISNDNKEIFKIAKQLNNYNASIIPNKMKAIGTVTTIINKRDPRFEEKGIFFQTKRHFFQKKKAFFLNYSADQIQLMLIKNQKNLRT